MRRHLPYTIIAGRGLKGGVMSWYLHIWDGNRLVYEGQISYTRRRDAVRAAKRFVNRALSMWDSIRVQQRYGLEKQE
jgi:hypothetical protein